MLPTPPIPPQGDPSTPEPSALSANAPLVSIIVRSMDRPSLARALDSIAAQSWPAIEVVLVNAKGQGHAPMPDSCGRFGMRTVGGAAGLSRSRAANAGLQAARGQWACFLDDDDWFAPRHIEILARRLLQAPQAPAAYAGVSCVEADPVTGAHHEVMQYNLDFDATRLLCENYLPIHSVLFSKAAAARTAGFDEQLAIFEDWDFWIQLSRIGPFVHVNDVTATYVLGSGDSGLYGNTALQEEFAQRILRKWQPLLAGEDWARLWTLCRQGLRAKDALARATEEARQANEEILRASERAKQSVLAVEEANKVLAKAHAQAAEAHAMAEQARAATLQAQSETLLERAAADHQRSIADQQRAIADEQRRIADLHRAASEHQIAQLKEAQAAALLAREEASQLSETVALTRGEVNRVFAASIETERLRREAVAAHLQQGEALQSVMKEYHSAMALLHQEQYTVARPIARNLKRVVRGVWRRLPPPMQKIVRKVLGRPAPVGTPAPPAVVPGAGEANDWKQVLAGGKPGAFTVIVFPVIDWHFRIQRPQHLARELGKQGHRVLYLSTTFASGSGPSDLRVIESPAENVHLLQLPLAGPVPNLYEDSLSPAQARELAGVLAWLQRAADLGPFVSLVNLPFWSPVATAVPANTIVYDCMDYHAGFSTNTGTMLGEEEGLLRDCNLLLTTSARLADLMQAKAPGKPHALVRNGTQVEHFAKAPEQLRLERDGRPVIGYFGAISEWFDIDLVASIARERPDWRIVLVGSTFGCDVSIAKQLPNIEFVGEVPYSELPGWVHAFDVCMIPFILNELTMCTNPVKVYEYLSAGKPVVATRMPELEAIADQVHLARDARHFVTQTEQALAEPVTAKAIAARRKWASSHSWESRAAALSTAVADCMPKASVIVLCYNNLALTQACLDSVERHSMWPKLELVVVDNASSDGTPAWLKEFARKRPWVRLVLNKDNKGFAAGNNDGLAAASGDILIMLNNDTEVSPGWIHGLNRHFQRDPLLGMVGPVTDNIGNEAKIDVGFTGSADMPDWAADHAVRHAGARMKSRVLAFFCVALRREVYEKVGGLDESFGLGFFEDDDYCNRVRQAGWEMAIAEDVFVHHHLSASFDKLKSTTRQALFEKNKAIYESKWGPWVPHQYREANTTE